MRNKIVGGVVVVWGILALVRWYFAGQEIEGGYYGAGQMVGLAVSVLLVAAGLYTFFKQPK